MNDTTRTDLDTIFGNSLPDSLKGRLIECLDRAIQIYPDSVAIKTRNDKGGILKFQGTTYFSLVYKLKESPVIAAGAVEKGLDNRPTPVIRFRNANSVLQAVSLNHKFPYKKPNWTNVEISDETIDLFPALLRIEISEFFSKISPAINNPSANNNDSKDDKALFFLIIALVIAAAIITISNWPSAADDPQPLSVQSSESSPIPKPSESGYSNPEHLDRETIYSAIKTKFGQSSEGIIKTVSIDGKQMKVTVDYGKYRDASDIIIDVAVALHRIDGQISKWNRVTIVFPQTSRTFSRNTFEKYRAGTINDLQFLALVN